MRKMFSQEQIKSIVNQGIESGEILAPQLISFEATTEDGEITLNESQTAFFNKYLLLYFCALDADEESLSGFIFNSQKYQEASHGQSMIWDTISADSYNIEPYTNPSNNIVILCGQFTGSYSVVLVGII